MPNNFLSKIQRVVKDPLFSLKRKFVNIFPDISPDKWFLQVKFYKCMGYKLDLKHPRTFNEKLQWLKLYDRNPLYTTLVDKYRVKQYVAEKIGEEYIVPTLAVYQSVDDIELDKLPSQFVLKCNHDSGSVVICQDKNRFDLAAAKEKLKKALNYNYYLDSREWPYKKIQRCIILEPYLEDNMFHELRDYKFFVFDGQPKVLLVATDRQNRERETCFTFFDMDYHQMDIISGHPIAQEIPSKPKCFEEMKIFAAKISRGLPHVRCDFYEVNGKMFFGELTLYHWSGFVPFQPFEYNNIFGELINISGFLR